MSFMALLDLPAGLILHVMDYVGSTYFHQDSRRLTVCKEWLKYALPASYKANSVSQSSLRCLLDTPDVSHTLTSIKAALDTLSIVVPGNERPNHPAPNNADQLESINSSENEFAGSVPAFFDTDLARLARTTKEARKLRCLQIHAPSNLESAVSQPFRHNILRNSTIHAFLSAENLTSLNIDLCGRSLKSSPEGGEHMCHSIGNLLASLTRLRLRMRCICIYALTPLKYATNLRLTEVIVNLSLYVELLVPRSAAHATPCTGGGRLKLRNDVEEQATDLLDRMTTPEKVRVLTHTLPEFNMRSLDVLTGRYMELEEGADWADDSQAIVDDVDSESDILSVDSAISSST